MKKLMKSIIIAIILSIISLIVMSCSIWTLIGDPGVSYFVGGGSGSSGGSGISGNSIVLNQPITPIIATPVIYNNPNNASCKIENGLYSLGDGTDHFVVGNDTGSNPNVYIAKYHINANGVGDIVEWLNFLTIDFTLGTNEQLGNLYIDQDTNNLYVAFSHNNGNNVDVALAKADKNNLTLVNSFGSGNPINGVVLLDKGNSENSGGILVDSTNNVAYIAGYNNQGKSIIFKMNTNDGSLVNTFGNNGYAEIDADSNNNIAEIITDILTDGTNLILVGHQNNGNLILFKVNPLDGSLINNSLITINPPSGETFVAAPLDAVISENKVYLGANLQPSGKSVLAIFDLSNNTANYYTFKDPNDNDLKITIRDANIYSSYLYLSGSVINNSNYYAAYIKVDINNLNGEYFINYNSNNFNIWGNMPSQDVVMLLGGSSDGNEFILLILSYNAM